jgi:2-hydroxychromene-2-carboxylate isomerase
MSSSAVTLYYSLRSPYSWLACRRLERVRLGADVRFVAVFPPPGMTPASTSSPRRLAYTRDDATRIAAAYGYTVRWPETLDTEWVRPHGCAYWAMEAGRGTEFILAAHAARFERGEDLGAAPALAGIFGVPTFVLDGELFWGNDRLEWLIRRIEQSRGRAVPDLAAQPLAPVCWTS